jgi:nicotinamidase-related amidase
LIKSKRLIVCFGVFVAWWLGNMNKSKTALLVIDCQNYFFDPASPAYLQASAKILPRINRLIALAQVQGWPVVFTVHGPKYDASNPMRKKWRRLPQGDDCLLHQDIIIPPRTIIFNKQHYSAFTGTGLEEWLRSRKINRLMVCGVMTHLCVDTTVRQAFMLGFTPVIIADACCSKTAALHKAALLALEHGFAEVLSTKAAGERLSAD